MNPDLSWTCIGKAISVYHIQTREWLNRVKMWFWMKIFNSICYRIMILYCTAGLLLDCCFSKERESFELMSPPSAAPPKTYPRMHFNGLNIVSQHFYTLGNNGFPSAAELFPLSPCVCQHKSSSSTQHSKYLSMCHFLSLIRWSLECLSHFFIKKFGIPFAYTKSVRNQSEYRVWTENTFSYFLSYFSSFHYQICWET